MGNYTQKVRWQGSQIAGTTAKADLLIAFDHTGQITEMPLKFRSLAVDIGSDGGKARVKEEFGLQRLIQKSLGSSRGNHFGRKKSKLPCLFYTAAARIFIATCRRAGVFSTFCPCLYPVFLCSPRAWAPRFWSVSLSGRQLAPPFTV